VGARLGHLFSPRVLGPSGPEGANTRADAWFSTEFEVDLPGSAASCCHRRVQWRHHYGRGLGGMHVSTARTDCGARGLQRRIGSSPLAWGAGPRNYLHQKSAGTWVPVSLSGCGTVTSIGLKIFFPHPEPAAPLGGQNIPLRELENSALLTVVPRWFRVHITARQCPREFLLFF